MQKHSSRYEGRGVSAQKTEVHAAIKNLDKGLFPKAFCKILPDFVGGSDDFVNIMHADTAGTKTSLAYLIWKETGRTDVWKKVVQDAIVMNVDDMACVGVVDDIILSSTIGRNKNRIPGEVLKALIDGASEFIDKMASLGIQIHHSGGETADVGDIVRTVDVGFTTFARAPKNQIIVNNIKPGQVIYALASYGQCQYEDEYNSGIGSNGLTSARHDSLHRDYREKYPEACDELLSADLAFVGPHKLDDIYELEGHQHRVGDLLSSPTRTYLPFVAGVLREKVEVSGMIHCTGGAQTKVMKFVDNVHIIKDDLFGIPPVFQMIREASGTEWSEMYQVFNMGHRLELYVDESELGKLEDIARGLGLEGKVIGRVEESQEKKLSIKGPEDVIEYGAESF